GSTKSTIAGTRRNPTTSSASPPSSPSSLPGALSPAVFTVPQKHSGSSVGSSATSATTPNCSREMRSMRKTWSDSEVVKISHSVMNGTSLLNLDGFAPASQWEELSAALPADVGGSDVA